MRTRKAFYNTLSGFLYQVITIVCAFILPRLILLHFGSAYNGLISSITQFLSWIAILNMGVGGVTRAALYKPLALKNHKAISSIIKATDCFMKRIAIIFVALLIAFALIYPVIVINDFEYLFTSTLILTIGVNTFFQYYFGMSYQILLEADQKNYVIAIVRVITITISTILASVLIIFEFDIRIVKLASSLVFSLNPLCFYLYVKNNYYLDNEVAPDNSTIKQRWDAFAQEIAIMINSNMDIIILTLFMDVKIISVFVIYNMIMNGVRQFLQTFTTGIGAAFGNMLALGMENKDLNDRLNVFEFIVYNTTTILFTVTVVTMIPFVSIYTSGIEDINYIQPVFAYLIILSTMFNCYRIPYQTIVYAAGKFKETKKGALLEAVVHLLLSLVFVNLWGLEGIALSALLAGMIRTSQYAIFLSENVIKRNSYIFAKKIIISLLSVLIVFGIYDNCDLMDVLSYGEWVKNALEVTFVSICVNLVIDVFLYRNELCNFAKSISRLFFSR